MWFFWRKGLQDGGLSSHLSVEHKKLNDLQITTTMQFILLIVQVELWLHC